MQSFLDRHASKITAVLSGFDRMVFRGYLRYLSYAAGFRAFLSCQGVLLKNFAQYVHKTTEQVKEASLQSAADLGRPVKFLNSSLHSKEAEARRILAHDPIESGLICVLTSVEPCVTYEIHRSRERQRLELRRAIRTCLHLYHYFVDPRFGFMRARIATWFPFDSQVCLNGREWLARQMHRVHLPHTRREHCFPWIKDACRAQTLMNRQLSVAWPRVLRHVARALNPAHRLIFRDHLQEYYWCLHQSEWAPDVIFRDAASLAAIYPSRTLHAIPTCSRPDVMRFLGQKVPHAFTGEIISSFKDRPEGIRVKHQIRANSLKMYDKQGSVLRVETTLNRPQELKVYRAKEGDPTGTHTWRPLRKGVADIHRLATLSQDSNARDLESLATAADDTPVRALVAHLCRPTTFHGRRVRALRPWSPGDLALLTAIARGEFVIAGFRNRHITALLHPTARSPQERRRRMAATTRLLRILRAHGLIKRIPKTHRDQVTKRGRRSVSAMLAAHAAPVSRLAQAA